MVVVGGGETIGLHDAGREMMHMERTVVVFCDCLWSRRGRVVGDGVGGDRWDKVRSMDSDD